MNAAVRPVQTYVEVPLENSERVRFFFKVHGAGAGARGFQLTFIAKETGLTATQTMVALCALIECGELEVTATPYHWTFFPKGARDR